MGHYIGIQPDQLIRLKKLPYREDTTVAKAVEEAINFCIDNNLKECELDYDGFLFDIEPTSDLRTKLNDYHRARGGSSHEDSGLGLQHVSISACPSCSGSPIEENGASKHCPYCDFYF